MMEFTRSGRLRASGRRRTGWGLAVGAGAIVWAVLANGQGRDTAYLLMALAALGVLTGIRELRRAARPFSLRVDEQGITLVDGGLGWGQIEGVALHYRAAVHVDSDDGATAAPPPHLHVFPTGGAELPGLRASVTAGRRFYDVADAAELDQGPGRLIEALTRYAGPRLEAAPHGLRRAVAPGPATLQGPGFGPLTDAAGFPRAAENPAVAARTFTARRHTGARLLLALALAVAGTAATVPLFTGHLPWGPEPAAALAPLGAMLGWGLSALSFRSWMRPLRLRIGPDGLAVQNAAVPEVAIGWDQVVAVAVAHRPGATEKHLWLLLWPVPGHSFDLPHEFTDGHRTYPLVELRRLRDGDEVERTARYFAGSRYAESA
ncbi:hypothetical protein [Streptomyces sp. NBC_01462]|uniref:hypothetical protein n=2 Tax=unclassified Streptomyces TaxID=2593676 RepID=UPI002E374ED4|nr:hypothetical protein [Streptomyces sp. NBC_01462]